MSEIQEDEFDQGRRELRDPTDLPSPAQPPPEGSRTPTDVYLVEDFPILRDGLRTILEGAGHRVVGESDHPTPAVADLVRMEPPVAVVDLCLDHHSGIEVLEQVQRRHLPTRVIVLSLSEQAREVAEAVRLGACGYLLKDSPANELLSAVDRVAGGGKHLGPRAQQLAVEGLIRENRQANTEPLSLREKQIVMLVLRGRSSAAIADALFLSPKTVDSYRSRVMGKLGVYDLPALVRLAIREGWISADEV